MRTLGASSTITKLFYLRLLAVGLLVSAQAVALAQSPAVSGVDAQREAMRRLAFLAGQWSGPVTVTTGQGEPLHLTQTEDIEFKLDGLVLLIEGTSRDADGKVRFNALATVAYDDVTHAYRFRAYNGGRYVDTELTVAEKGFSWGYPAGPGQVENTMRLTAKGQWNETTDFVMGNDPPHRSVEMLLEHK
jgi:hypothetical protein